VKFPPNDRGVTLVETMIAVLVALIGVFGLGTLIFQATVTNKNQGTEVTRATIYAQDKMELLLSEGAAGPNTASLATPVANFCTCTQSCTPPPANLASPPAACNSSGIATAAWNTGLVAGGVPVNGAMVTACPTVGASIGYVDFLDINGNQLSGASCAAIDFNGAAYVRMWQISDVAATGGPALKQVTVGVWSQAALNTTGAPKPVVVLTSYMSNPN
jgi:Tfp pilus assembly protein PilV